MDMFAESFRKAFLALAVRGAQSQWQEDQLTLIDEKAGDCLPRGGVIYKDSSG